MVLTGADYCFSCPAWGRWEWAGFTGAGLAVLLINVLVRIGNEGERDREREETARRYFDEHGRWPN